MLHYKFIHLFTILIFFSCNNDDKISKPLKVNNFSFEDGFETQNNLVDELFPANQNRWTSIQQSNPSNATNQLSVSEVKFSEGKNSLRLFAYKSDDLISKIDVEKSGFSAFANDTVIIKADFYINNTANIENLLLIDLECCSCWDPTVNTENQCPGVRLKMSGGNDFLAIERGKIGESTIEQTSIPFPRKQWVTVEWELILSDKENGINKLSINGTEIINSTGTNMPNAQTFQKIFAKEGINFTLQEPVFYERVQIGATANSSSEDIELFVDNFSIKIKKRIY